MMHGTHNVKIISNLYLFHTIFFKHAPAFNFEEKILCNLKQSFKHCTKMFQCPNCMCHGLASYLGVTDILLQNVWVIIRKIRTRTGQ